MASLGDPGAGEIAAVETVGQCVDRDDSDQDQGADGDLV
jgi:hypothetical protein